MRYPRLTNSKCAALALQLVRGEDPSIEPHVEWVGRGDDIDLGPVSRVAKLVLSKSLEWSDRDRDRFEGWASPRLRRALAGVPTEVLDDRGFWRYLSLRYFWDFIAWREAKAFAAGNHLKYVDASLHTEAVLPRMYLRACAVGSEHVDLAAAIPYGADFWRSHVIRVRIGSAPAMARALVTRQSIDRLATNPLRQAAKRITRHWANIVPYVYDDTDAPTIIEAIWGRETDGTGAAAGSPS